MRRVVVHIPPTTRRVRAHHWVSFAAVARQLCVNCGLVWLRNAASNRAANAGCTGMEDA
jgi:hypothetical protein